MRLSIQGCLILLLCFFYSGSVSAQTQAEAFQLCKDYESSFSNKNPHPTSCIDKKRPDGSGYYDARICTGIDCASWGYSKRYSYDPPAPCNEFWTHQPDPITGQSPNVQQKCSCVAGWVDDGEENEPRCVISRNQEPEECYENGQIYDPNLGYCVLDCPNGQLNGICLQDTADNSESCNSSSPDYKGSIGFGNKKQNICESDMTCEAGSLGIVNDIQICIPDEYGPPTCASDGIIVMDEHGYVCEGLNDTPEETEEPEEPNTDTDGDGEPDTYDPDNDPNYGRKQLDKLNKSQDKGNQSLENLENLIGKSNSHLDGISGQIKDISDGMDTPDGGFGFGALLDIPTLTESATNIKTVIANSSVGQSLDGLTGIPSNTSCPVWTIPATDYWSALPMTAHCEALENQRSLLAVIFMFFWSGIALFTFFKA